MGKMWSFKFQNYRGCTKPLLQLHNSFDRSLNPSPCHPIIAVITSLRRQIIQLFVGLQITCRKAPFTKSHIHWAVFPHWLDATINLNSIHRSWKQNILFESHSNKEYIYINLIMCCVSKSWRWISKRVFIKHQMQTCWWKKLMELIWNSGHPSTTSTAGSINEKPSFHQLTFILWSVPLDFLR